MDRKLDTERQIITRIAQRAFSRGIKEALPRTRIANMVQNFAFSSGGGTGSFGGTPPVVDSAEMVAAVYGMSGGTIGTTNDVTRTKVEAAGMVYLYDDLTNNAYKIMGETINDPTYWILS